MLKLKSRKVTVLTDDEVSLVAGGASSEDSSRCSPSDMCLSGACGSDICMSTVCDSDWCLSFNCDSEGTFCISISCGMP